MSKLALTPNSSGSGTYTLASPNNNASHTITLPVATGTLLTSTGDGSGLTGIVSGGMTLLEDTEITADVDYIDIDFDSGYKTFLITIKNLVNTLTVANNYRELRARFKDSSGNLITTGDYFYQTYDGSLYAATKDVPQIDKLAYMSTNTGPAVGPTTMMRIHFPLQSELCTGYEAFMFNPIQASYNNEVDHALATYGGIQTAGVNSGIRLYPYGNQISSSTDRYQVWGTK